VPLETEKADYSASMFRFEPVFITIHVLVVILKFICETPEK
jgi:hypothetical protein